MSFRSKLIGAWELVSYTGVNKDDPNDIKYPMGKDCVGIILYTPDGYMSAHLNRQGTPTYSEGTHRGTTEERAQVAADTLAYSGTYYVKEAEGDGPHDLKHLVKVGVPRNWIGKVQNRPARIVEENGDTYLCLEASAVPDDEGVLRLAKVKWRRLKDNSQGETPP